MAPTTDQNSFKKKIMLITKQCKWCGEEFKTKKYWQLFCQPKCRFNYHNYKNLMMSDKSLENK